jgi:hypothetical protein
VHSGDHRARGTRAISIRPPAAVTSSIALDSWISTFIAPIALALGSMETSIFVTDLAQQFSLSVVGPSHPVVVRLRVARARRGGSEKDYIVLNDAGRTLAGYHGSGQLLHADSRHRTVLNYISNGFAMSLYEKNLMLDKAAKIHLF